MTRRREAPTQVQAPKQLELAEARIADTMHPGVLTCSRETPLRDVARMLAFYNVHCVVVYGSEEGYDGAEEEPWAVISDLDVVGAALNADADERTAGGSAGSPVILISGSDTLAHAAQLMTEYQTSHLLVVDPDTGRPVGVLSTLDLAAALAGLPVRSGPPPVDRR